MPSTLLQSTLNLHFATSGKMWKLTTVQFRLYLFPQPSALFASLLLRELETSVYNVIIVALNS